MLTSADFGQSHNVLYRAPILQPAQFDLGSLDKVSGRSLPAAPASFTDVIDLNQDGETEGHIDQSQLRADYPLYEYPHVGAGKFQPWKTSVKVVSDDPSLGRSLESLKAQGVEKGTQVLTQNDIIDPGTIKHEANIGYDFTKYDFDGSNDLNPYNGAKSSLSALRDSLTAAQPDSGAKWAIDLQRNEFILYADKAKA